MRNITDAPIKVQKREKEEVFKEARVLLKKMGLEDKENAYPYQLSGGQQQRVSIARALAMNPKILFFDEPRAGLDPVSSRRLDELILQMRDSTGATVVIVTHELASIFTVADRAIDLDNKTRTQTAIGNPKELLKSGNADVRTFLNRGVDPLSTQDKL